MNFLPSISATLERTRVLRLLSPHLLLGLWMIGVPISESRANQPNNIDDNQDELLAPGVTAPASGLPTWHISEPYINLWVLQQPMTYRTSYGGSIAFSIAYKQRNSRSNSKIFGLGSGWECSWLSYVEYSTNGSSVTVGANWVATGGRRDYVANGPPEFKSGSTMTVLTNGSGNCLGFQINKPSGARDKYGYLFNCSASENYAMLSEQIDAVGRTNRFTYDVVGNVVRLRQMIDSDNRTSTVEYDGSFNRQINRVVNHYGGKTSFSYDASGRLQNTIVTISETVTWENDEDGNPYATTNSVTLTTATFSYNGLVSGVTTPYGTTSFIFPNSYSQEGYDLGGDNKVNRSIVATEGNGDRHLYCYRDLSSIIVHSYEPFIPGAYPSSEVPNTSPLSNTFPNIYMSARNSYYWGPKQLAGMTYYYTFENPEDFDSLLLEDWMLARRRHWLRAYNDAEYVTDTLALEQAPSPDKVNWGQKYWYDHAGKVSGKNWTRGTNSSPRFVATVLPDGSTRYTYFERNQWSHPTRIVDTYTPGSGNAYRTNNFVFAANGIDLAEHRGPSGELLSGMGYNGFHQIVTLTNAVDDRTYFTYDSGQRLTGVQWPTGSVTTNFYYTSGLHIGWLQKTVDYEASTGTAFRTNSFAYENGLVSSSTDRRGLTLTRTWDMLSRLTSLTGPNGTTTSEYVKLHQEKVTNPLGHVKRAYLDVLTRPKDFVDHCPHTNSFGYGSGLLTSATNALGQVTGLNYDFQHNVLSTTFPDGSTVTNKYNPLGQLTVATDKAGVTLTNYYNNQGLLRFASNALGQVFSCQYDVRDRATNLVNASGVAVLTTYDALNRTLTRGYPDNGVEKFEYSARGLAGYTNQLGRATRYGYDALGRKVAETNANSERVLYTYNAAGDLLTLTDGKNQVTQWQYDPFGRMTNRIDALGNSVERCKYDAIGRMTNQWSVAKGDTYLTFDSEDRVTAINYPASPDISFGYDKLHRMTNMVDAAGQTAFAYTAFGALRTEDGPWPDDTITYDYKTNHLRAAFTVSQGNRPNWVCAYAYDAANRLTNIVSGAGSFTYEYSPGAGSPACASALIRKLIFPSGAYVTNSFDAVARLLDTRLRNSSNTDLNSHSYLINQGNQRYKHTRLDGSYVDYTYDDIGQLKTATAKESGGTTNRLFETFGYGYDTAWNLNARTNNALVQSFGVNSRNHLTGVTRSGTMTVAGTNSAIASSVTVSGQTAVRYTDNLFAKDGLSLSDGNNTFTAIAQDSYGRSATNSVAVNLPASVSYTHDANGNLTSDGLRGLEYDDANQLTRITVTNSWKSEFTYDGFGRRRVRKEFVWYAGAWQLGSETRYVYDGQLVVQERDGNNSAVVNYTRGLDLSGSLQRAGGIGGLLARSANVSVTSQHSFYHADGGGNVTALIDANQQVAARYWYSPFGTLLAYSGPLAEANLYRFSSKEVHENSGLVYYGRRYYDPSLQRWLNGDPLREGGGINLYQFAGGDPINRVDPWGLVADFTEEIGDYTDANGLVKGTLITISGKVKLFWSYSDRLNELRVKPEDLAKRAEDFWAKGPIESDHKDASGRPIYYQLKITTETMVQNSPNAAGRPDSSWNVISFENAPHITESGRKSPAWVDGSEWDQMHIYLEGIQGIFGKRDLIKTFHHEFGHLLNHGDAYIENKQGVFFPDRWWKNPMSDSGGTPDKRNVEALIYGNYYHDTRPQLRSSYRFLSEHGLKLDYMIDKGGLKNSPETFQ